MEIAEADLADQAVRAIIELHQRGMSDISPAGTCFALDVSGLSGPEVTLFGAWIDGQLAGIGAMKRLGEGLAEIKSMRTDPAYLGQGVARAILEAIIARAKIEGIRQLSLETGTSEGFAPAIGLYRQRGFTPGEAFASYINGPHNQCYHLPLQQ